MTELSYQVSFNAPAFLGNAEQQAQWRTPPFKALLRQWWRVVKAADVGYDVNELRRREALLFGTASDDGESGSQQSRIRFRLDQWVDGDLKAWPQGGASVSHPEVRGGNPPVDAELYLGYGPLENSQGTTRLTVKPASAGTASILRTAIAVSSVSKGRMGLRLRFPREYEIEVRSAMQLVAWFGTIGSRSRNGWGALQVEQGELEPMTVRSVLPFCRPLEQCLALDWPHAIGISAGKPLVWTTAPKNNWREVMKELARIKIAFRTEAAPFPRGKPGGMESRHLISYPLGTKHQVTDWGSKVRLPNQLRFKLHAHQDKLVGVIVHLPCRLPAELEQAAKGRLPDALALWKKVHAVLDQPDNKLTRLA